MDDIEMKVLESLSDGGSYVLQDLTDQLGEDSGVEATLEALQTRGFIAAGDEETWMITDQGLDSYNQQIEREA